MKNFKLLILIFHFSLLIFNLFPKAAEAGFLINRPLYIGLADGLVGYWSFNGSDINATQARDTSGNGNHGTLTNGPVRTEGKIGQALNFDGVDDVVNAGSATSLDDLGPMTASAWIYPRSQGEGNAGTIVFKGTAASIGFWRFSLIATNALQFTEDPKTDLQRTSSNNAITLNTWQHVAVTWDGSNTAANARIYVNGAEVSYQTTTDGLGLQSDAALDFFIGNDSAGGVTFDGLIDDVRVYNRALSTDEIKRLYKMGATTKINVPRKDTLTNGLAGYWTFDGPDMAVDTAYDRSGNANNGTLTNGPVRTEGKIGQALNFDGVNDFVNVPSISIPSATTWSAWVKLSSYTNADAGYPMILSTGVAIPAHELRFFGTTGIPEVIWNYNNAGYGYIQSDSAISLNTWHLISTTYDGTTLILYVDGVNKNSTPSTYTAPTTIKIGIRSNQFALNGLIDEVRVYNRALSPDEIKRLYNMGR